MSWFNKLFWNQSNEGEELEVWGWGSNESFQLGIDNRMETCQFVPIPLMGLNNKKIASVHCGYHHSAAIDVLGQVYTWGNNSHGQLGHPLDTPSCTPPKGYFPRIVSSIKQTPATLIALGESHSVVLHKNGSLSTAGNSQHGVNDVAYDLKLHSVSKTTREILPFSKNNSPIMQEIVKQEEEPKIDAEIDDIPWALIANKRVQPCFEKIGRTLATRKVVQVSVGARHTICLTEGKEVFGWGDGHQGQMGLGPENIMVTEPTLISALNGKYAKIARCGYDWTVIVSDSGDLFVFGSNASCKLGLGKTPLEEEARIFIPTYLASLGGTCITQIECGFDHTVALSDEGKVYTWGYGANGKLGVGDEIDRTVPTMVETLKNEFISQIAAGSYHTIAVTRDGVAYAWGWNHYGQVGIGNVCDDIQCTPVLVSGLENKKIVNIACGEQHSLVLVKPK